MASVSAAKKGRSALSPYSLSLLPAARRDLRKLPSDVHDRIEATMSLLESNPRPPGCRKLVGFKNEWRLRVGDYRVLYIIDDDQSLVIVARVAHRREAYR